MTEILKVGNSVCTLPKTYTVGTLIILAGKTHGESSARERLKPVHFTHSILSIVSPDVLCFEIWNV